MGDNIEVPYRLVSISKRFGINFRKLEKLFRQNLNVMPSDYYLNLRMEHAREYLFYSGMSVKEISVASGFSSPSVFCRAFTKNLSRISAGIPAERIGRRFEEVQHHLRSCWTPQNLLCSQACFLPTRRQPQFRRQERAVYLGGTGRTKTLTGNVSITICWRSCSSVHSMPASWSETLIPAATRKGINRRSADHRFFEAASAAFRIRSRAIWR